MSHKEPLGADLSSSSDWFSGSPLGQVVYDRTYARTKADGTKETWPETVERVVRGNCGLVAPEHIEEGEPERLIELMLSRQILPAGRHLWCSGVPGRTFLMNCHRAGFGPGLADHFTFTFDELMKGGGVGANYSTHYLRDLPPVSSPVQVRFICWLGHPNRGEVLGHDLKGPTPLGRVRYVMVPDSREGWVEALWQLFEAFQQDTPQTVVFNVSQVRPRGEPIRGFGGTSGGPGPLVEALRNVATILNRIVGQSLTPLTAMEIDHALAQCVVSGNVRRSARMSMLHWNDPYIGEFLSCKADPSAHWSTNISVVVDENFFSALGKGGHADWVMDRVVDGMLLNGEPGLYNIYLAQQGERGDVGSTNPCGEIALEEWEPCNLGHVNLAVGDAGSRLEGFRLMARFLVRATFGDVEDPRQKEILSLNRRIGVGFLGLQEYLANLGIKMSRAAESGSVRRSMSLWRQVVRAEADRYADELGIPRPIKVTAVAPTGTISKLAGTTEGIHPIYARHFIRRVRYAVDDPAVADFREQGYHIEEDIYSPHTVVVSFPCEDPLLQRVIPSYLEQADELHVEDLLALQAVVQTHYADNAVSHTLNVPPGMKADDLREALVRYLPMLKGLTVMVDETRAQAPYERITEDEYRRMTGQSVMAPDMECVNGCPIR